MNFLHLSRHLDEQSPLPDPSRFGRKATGLFAFPIEWTPPFLLVDISVHTAWTSADEDERLALCDLILEHVQRSLIPHVGRYLRDSDGVLVRSSAIREGLRKRGQLETRHFTDLSAIELRNFLSTLFDASTESTGGIALIVQAAAPVDRYIHLSNERRFSKTKNEWLISQSLPGSIFVPPEGCNSIRARALDESQPLRLTPGQLERDLRAVLRGVGKWANRHFAPRVHFEIVTSGSRVFLVQADVEEEVDGVDPTSTPLTFCPGDPSRAATFRLFHPSDPCRFTKLQNISDFRTSDYEPPHRLFYATAQALKEVLALGSDLPLAQEISAITGGRLVIREDIVDENKSHFNLHRTDTITSDEAVSQIGDRIGFWESQNKNLDDVCIILHGFVPSRASAWAMYSRSDQRIRINALWGLPDGLQYLTPDEYELDLATGGWSERIHFKEFFLHECDDGAWRIDPILLNVARTKVLSRPQAKQIANLTRDIGNQISSDVHIMFFCGIPREAGVGDVLPWYRAREVSTYEAKREKRLQRIVVRRAEDLKDIDTSRPIAISLMPDIENYRSNEFIDAVANFAVSNDIPIEIQGSPLAHAYYILRHAGCTVFLSYAPAYERVRSKREFGKLVRDKIVQKIVGRGEKSVSFNLSHDDRAPAFFGKLIEEGLEVLRASSNDSRIAELADVYEVMRGWIESSDFELSEVEAIADLKRQKTGGFAAAEVLVETGSKLSALGGSRSSGLTLEKITSPREQPDGLEIPAGRLGLIARGQPTMVHLKKLDISIALSMNDEGDLIIRAGRLSSDADSGQLDFFQGSGEHPPPE